MHKLEKFLFFYSIVAVTVFFISFGLFSPQPLNFISGVLLLPMLFYFWIKLTNPSGTNFERWSVRFIISLAVLSFLGIYGYKLAAQLDPSRYNSTLKSQLSEALRKNEELVQKLNATNKTPEPLETPDPEGETVADIIIGKVVEEGGTRITLKQGVESGYIYLDKNPNSQKLDTIIKGVNYPFIEKAEGWYKVAVSENKSGWVNSKDVNELE